MHAHTHNVHWHFRSSKASFIWSDYKQQHGSKASVPSADPCQPCQRQTRLALPQCHGWDGVWSLLGSQVKAVHTGCPQWPPKLPSLGRCVCVSVSAHPGSSPGPGKSQGHTDTDLSSATLRLIPDFMGAREGEGLGRCAQLGPPEFQPQRIGTSLFH